METTRWYKCLQGWPRDSRLFVVSRRGLTWNSTWRVNLIHNRCLCLGKLKVLSQGNILLEFTWPQKPQTGPQKAGVGNRMRCPDHVTPAFCCPHASPTKQEWQASLYSADEFKESVRGPASLYPVSYDSNLASLFLSIYLSHPGTYFAKKKGGQGTIQNVTLLIPLL